jgi:hypothetical protein
MAWPKGQAPKSRASGPATPTHKARPTDGFKKAQGRELVPLFCKRRPWASFCFFKKSKKGGRAGFFKKN